MKFQIQSGLVAAVPFPYCRIPRNRANAKSDSILFESLCLCLLLLVNEMTVAIEIASKSKIKK